MLDKFSKTEPCPQLCTYSSTYVCMSFEKGSHLNYPKTYNLPVPSSEQLRVTVIPFIL